MPSSRMSGRSRFTRPGTQRDSLDEETTNWRAVCGKTARTVRRAGSAIADPDPYRRVCCWRTGYVAALCVNARYRSRGAFCARGLRPMRSRKSPRARGTPGVRRTHGLRYLATPKRNGDLGRGRRPVLIEPQVRLRSSVPRAVFEACSARPPVGVTFQASRLVRDCSPPGMPTHRFGAGLCASAFGAVRASAAKRPA